MELLLDAHLKQINDHVFRVYNEKGPFMGTFHLYMGKLTPSPLR